MSASPQPAPDHGPSKQRHTTVLFAELRGARPRRYVEVLGLATELSGGRVVHKRDNGVLALFATPNAAAAAAARMHTYAQSLPPASEPTGLRIGFHAGPVGQRDQDIFGDTVNLALQIADQAEDGQVLVTHDTASGLSPALQSLVRPSGHAKAASQADAILLGELAWRDALSEITAWRDANLDARAVLEVTYGARKVVRRRQGDAVLIGRGEECDLVVDGARASRRHCSIVRRGGSLILSDTSSNGTFVSANGAREIHLRGAEVTLVPPGTLSLGQPAACASTLVRYLCA